MRIYHQTMDLQAKLSNICLIPTGSAIAISTGFSFLHSSLAGIHRVALKWTSWSRQAELSEVSILYVITRRPVGRNDVVWDYLWDHIF